MQIVIDISEESYKNIKEQVDKRDYPDMQTGRAIINGIPLPKGHGQRIDADELKKHKYHDNDRFENAVAVAQIDLAETIIEADMERSKEE